MAGILGAAVAPRGRAAPSGLKESRRRCGDSPRRASVFASAELFLLLDRSLLLLRQEAVEVAGVQLRANKGRIAENALEETQIGSDAADHILAQRHAHAGNRRVARRGIGDELGEKRVEVTRELSSPHRCRNPLECQGRMVVRGA